MGLHKMRQESVVLSPFSEDLLAPRTLFYSPIVCACGPQRLESMTESSTRQSGGREKGIFYEILTFKNSHPANHHSERRKIHVS